MTNFVLLYTGGGMPENEEEFSGGDGSLGRLV